MRLAINVGQSADAEDVLEGGDLEAEEEEGFGDSNGNHNGEEDADEDKKLKAQTAQRTADHRYDAFQSACKIPQSSFYCLTICPLPTCKHDTYIHTSQSEKKKKKKVVTF